jgi:hypothetical protein
MKLPQLSLRELFLLVVIAAMGCGWWLDSGRRMDYQHAREIRRKLHYMKGYLESRGYIVTLREEGVEIQEP